MIRTAEDVADLSHHPLQQGEQLVEHLQAELDTAVLFDAVPGPRGLDMLTADLEAAAGRRVDLVVLNTAPPLLAHQVVATGRLLVCHDDAERVAFEARTASRYFDTAYLRRVQHRYLREHVDAYRARSS